MSDGNFLGKQSILGAADFRFAELDAPSWGGKVRLRGLTGEEMAWTDKVMDDERSGKPNACRAAALAVCGIVDGQGANVFSRGDVTALAKKDGQTLNRIASEVLRLSSATSETFQELEGN